MPILATSVTWHATHVTFVCKCSFEPFWRVRAPPVTAFPPVTFPGLVLLMCAALGAMWAALEDSRPQTRTAANCEFSLRVPPGQVFAGSPIYFATGNNSKTGPARPGNNSPPSKHQPTVARTRCFAAFGLATYACASSQPIWPGEWLRKLT